MARLDKSFAGEDPGELDDLDQGLIRFGKLFCQELLVMIGKLEL